MTEGLKTKQAVKQVDRLLSNEGILVWEIVKLYGKRSTIEESFRDGMGLSNTRIGDPARRDRLLLVSALAAVLLTVLGAAGEAVGIDRYLKANTVKKLTISLVRQGLMHYGALPMMKLNMLEPLCTNVGVMARSPAGLLGRPIQARQAQLIAPSLEISAEPWQSPINA